MYSHPRTVERKPRGLVARGLSKVYGSRTRGSLPSGITLEVRLAEFLVPLGPSDSGKSKLLNVMGGRDAPRTGMARWREHELTGASDVELTTYLSEHVGFVF